MKFTDRTRRRQPRAAADDLPARCAQDLRIQPADRLHLRALRQPHRAADADRPALRQRLGELGHQRRERVSGDAVRLDHLVGLWAVRRLADRGRQYGTPWRSPSDRSNASKGSGGLAMPLSKPFGRAQDEAVRVQARDGAAAGDADAVLLERRMACLLPEAGPGSGDTRTARATALPISSRGPGRLGGLPDAFGPGPTGSLDGDGSGPGRDRTRGSFTSSIRLHPRPATRRGSARRRAPTSSIGEGPAGPCSGPIRAGTSRSTGATRSSTRRGSGGFTMLIAARENEGPAFGAAASPSPVRRPGDLAGGQPLCRLASRM